MHTKQVFRSQCRFAFFTRKVSKKGFHLVEEALERASEPRQFFAGLFPQRVSHWGGAPSHYCVATQSHVSALPCERRRACPTGYMPSNARLGIPLPPLYTASTATRGSPSTEIFTRRRFYLSFWFISFCVVLLLFFRGTRTCQAARNQPSRTNERKNNRFRLTKLRLMSDAPPPPSIESKRAPHTLETNGVVCRAYFHFHKTAGSRTTSSVCCQSYESNKSCLGTVVLDFSTLAFTTSHLSTTCSPPPPELGSSGKLPSSQPEPTRMQSGKKTGGGERPPRRGRAIKTRSGSRVPRRFGRRAGLHQF